MEAADAATSRRHRWRQAPPRWVPKERCGETFPSAESLAARFGVDVTLLPAPGIPKPTRPSSSSHRVWHRYRRRRNVIDEANFFIGMLNGLHKGKVGTRKRRGCVGRRAPGVDGAAADKPYISELTLPQARLHNMALREAARLERARRVAEAMTGGQAIAKITKTLHVDGYFGPVSGSSHESLRAADVAEPSSLATVDMLAALPPEEAAFYRDEDNVLLRDGYSHEVFKELETAYGFVGGEYEEYCEYLCRSDLPPDLWDFTDDVSQVAAIAGLSVVPNKIRHSSKEDHDAMCHQLRFCVGEVSRRSRPPRR